MSRHGHKEMSRDMPPTKPTRPFQRLTIPAKRIGYLQPSKVHSGVWSACGEDMMGDAALVLIDTERARRDFAGNRDRKTR